MSAQNQALNLQLSLLEQLKDVRGATLAAADAGTPAAKPGARSGLPRDEVAESRLSMASVANLNSIKSKAASICFELAEYHRKHRQFDKVGRQLWLDAHTMC